METDETQSAKSSISVCNTESSEYLTKTDLTVDEQNFKKLLDSKTKKRKQHVFEAKIKTQICKHFEKGFCKLGDDCIFAHGNNEVRFAGPKSCKKQGQSLPPPPSRPPTLPYSDSKWADVSHSSDFHSMNKFQRQNFGEFHQYGYGNFVQMEMSGAHVLNNSNHYHNPTKSDTIMQNRSISDQSSHGSLQKFQILQQQMPPQIFNYGTAPMTPHLQNSQASQNLHQSTSMHNTPLVKINQSNGNVFFEAPQQSVQHIQNPSFFHSQQQQFIQTGTPPGPSSSFATPMDSTVFLSNKAQSTYHRNSPPILTTSPYMHPVTPSTYPSGIMLMENNVSHHNSAAHTYDLDSQLVNNNNGGLTPSGYQMLNSSIHSLHSNYNFSSQYPSSMPAPPLLISSSSALTGSGQHLHAHGRRWSSNSQTGLVNSSHVSSNSPSVSYGGPHHHQQQHSMESLNNNSNNNMRMVITSSNSNNGIPNLTSSPSQQNGCFPQHQRQHRGSNSHFESSKIIDFTNNNSVVLNENISGNGSNPIMPTQQQQQHFHRRSSTHQSQSILHQSSTLSNYSPPKSNNLYHSSINTNNSNIANSGNIISPNGGQNTHSSVSSPTTNNSHRIPTATTNSVAFLVNPLVGHEIQNVNSSGNNNILNNNYDNNNITNLHSQDVIHSNHSSMFFHQNPPGWN